MKILLLGCGGSAGLNFVRAARFSTNERYFIGTDLSAYNAAASNCDEKIHLQPRCEEEKVERVLELAKRVDMIHAQPDAEVGFLLRNFDTFKHKIFPHNFDAWKAFSNKLACQREWGGLRTILIPDLTEDSFEHLRGTNDRVWVRAIRGAGSRGALPVGTYQQALDWVRYWTEFKGHDASDFMACEYLPGAEYAVQTFWIDGELQHSQARERLVYFFANVMPSEQSSTPAVAETVDCRDVYETAYSAIKAITPNPHGIYCVDIKRNTQDTPIATEVNYGRFFTTSDFFATIGINTPDAYISYYATGVLPERKVETLGRGYTWIRALDRTPFLHRTP